MRLSLWFTLVIVAFLALQSLGVDGGIIRRSRRLRRVGLHRQGPRSPRVMQRRKWPHFLAPPRGASQGRSMRPSKHNHAEMREERFSRHRPMPHQLKRLPMMSHGQQPMMSASSQTNEWRPLDFGNPIDRDPTFDYAPPSLERVRFSEGRQEGRPEGRPESRKRKPPPKMANREAGKHRPQLFKPPRSSRPTIWKLLASKQRRRPQANRRPMNHYMRFPESPVHSNPNPNPNNKDEAEIFPRFPNMVYFQTKDVLGHHPHGNRPHGHGNGGKHHHHHNGGPMFLMPQRPPGPKPTQGYPVKPTPVTTIKPTQGQTLKQFSGQTMSHFSPPTLNQLSGQTLNPLPGLTIKLAPGLVTFPILKPGKVTNVPLYSHENQSPSQFNPITSTTPMTVNIPKQPDDILYRPQDFMNPTKKPTVLQPIYSTPVTLTATRNSVIKPIDPTESLVNIINDPPKPINGLSVLNQVNSLFEQFEPVVETIREEQILDDDDDDDLGEIEEARVVPVPNVYEQPPPAETPAEIPVKDNKGDESSTVSVSTSVSSSTSVLIRGTEVSTSSSTTESSASSSTSSPYPKLPEMPTYKKRQPIYPKRLSSIKSSGEKAAPAVSNSKDTNGSGEGLVITVARSKVKEYKPQFLANFTQLLTFDKVADADDNDSSESTIYITTALPSLKVTSAPVISSTTAKPSEIIPQKKSPMQDFDPMQLLHSWFQNT